MPGLMQNWMHSSSDKQSKDLDVSKTEPVFWQVLYEDHDFSEEHYTSAPDISPYGVQIFVTFT